MNAYQRVARAKLNADLEHALLEEDAALRGWEEDCIRAIKNARSARKRVRDLLGKIGQSLDDVTSAA